MNEFSTSDLILIYNLVIEDSEKEIAPIRKDRLELAAKIKTEIDSREANQNSNPIGSLVYINRDDGDIFTDYTGPDKDTYSKSTFLEPELGLSIKDLDLQTLRNAKVGTKLLTYIRFNSLLPYSIHIKQGETWTCNNKHYKYGTSEYILQYLNECGIEHVQFHIPKE